MKMLSRATINSKYTAFRLSRRLFGEKPLYQTAEKQWEIAPPETQKTPPSIRLPGQEDKIVEFEENTTREIETVRLNGGAVERPAVMAYQYSNAMIHRGGVFGQGGHKQILPHWITPPVSSEHPVIKVDEGALAGSYLGLRYFGHWLHDDAPLSLLAKEFGEAYSPTPPFMHAAGHSDSHVAGYVDLLQLPWKAAENVLFKSLVVCDDEAFTSHRGERLRKLRDRLKEKLGPPSSPKRLYVRRGISDEGVRKYHNEDEVAAALQKEGFVILEPTTMSVAEIATLAHGAEFVVSLEGSHMAHSLYFLREGGGMLAISPPERFATLFKCAADLMNFQYGFVVGDCEEEGFSVDVDNLKRTIDLYKS